MTRLSIDMPSSAGPLLADDWIVTRAGSRYIVEAVRPVRCRANGTTCERCRHPVTRWAVTVMKLPRHTPIPSDVRAIQTHWHGRRR
jgi:hypothetical protein